MELTSEIPDEEILQNLKAGNFQQAEKLASEWIESLPIGAEDTPEYKLAQEAYLYARFFLNRSERIGSMPKGRERAQAFKQYLERLQEIRDENEIEGLSPFYQAVKLFIFGNIAESLASDFSGQKAYSLDHEEVLLLAEALIETGRLKEAEAALEFLFRMHPKNAKVNLLLAYVYYLLGDENQFLLHFREALFINPDILETNVHRIPEGTLRKLWEKVAGTDEDRKVQFRTFALLLEIQKVYKNRRKLKKEEAERIKSEYHRMLEEYRKNPENQNEILPRLLHYLTWLILYYHGINDYESFEEYRSQMVSHDIHTWESFYKNNLE